MKLKKNSKDDTTESQQNKPKEKKWYQADRNRPRLLNPKRLIRASDGCYELTHSKAWGTCLIPIVDPEGKTLTEEEKKGIRLIDNFPKIPREQWFAWLSLCFAFCDRRIRDKTATVNRSADELEVSCLLLRNEGDMRDWKIVVPLQEISGGAVDADFSKTCDILTGEEYDIFPPVGWVHAGSSHSHNTMGAFFSSTDDKSELGTPGLHVVVGKIDTDKFTYEYKASIVLRGVRKYVDLEAVVEDDPIPVMFHENCYNFIKEKTVSRSYHGNYLGSFDDSDYYGGGYFGAITKDKKKEGDTAILHFEEENLENGESPWGDNYQRDEFNDIPPFTLKDFWVGEEEDDEDPFNDDIQGSDEFIDPEIITARQLRGESRKIHYDDESLDDSEIMNDPKAWQADLMD